MRTRLTAAGRTSQSRAVLVGETRGLINVPYSLWKSTRALDEIASHEAGAMSVCAKIAGTENM